MPSKNEGMGEAHLTVDAGVCKFRTVIVAKNDKGKVFFNIVSDCPHVKKLADAMTEGYTPFEALKMPYCANPIYEKCGTNLIHSACPIPSALIKSAEVASGFALKRGVKFEYDA